MLHEVLLALSGHPSPLFRKDGRLVAEDFTLLSPSEAALLQTVGRLSELHRQLREHVQWILTRHRSLICRAVATSIQQKHLTRFQHKILDVESKILTKDASLVGAYDIVPLASVVGEFDDWQRRMSWFWDMSRFMQPPSGSHTKLGQEEGCTGAAVINELRAAASTGFPEIEEVATDLSKVAETAWLRQLSSWLLYGKLPAHGADDFFVRAETRPEEVVPLFRKDGALLPGFVGSSTASSVLFIGKSLHQIKQISRTVDASDSALRSSTEATLARAHLRELSALELPIVPTQLARAVSTIRLSLSQNVLQHLLPIEKTLMLLGCLRHFMLLGKGEFAVALISEAESRLQARQQSMGRMLQQDPVRAMQSLSIKDGELHQALRQVWKSLVREENDEEDHLLDFARAHITLATPSARASRPSTSDGASAATPQISHVAFNDLLFPTATSLQLVIESPLDLFISPREADLYASINAYLLSIRRAQVRLSNLWRRTIARRDYPSPTGRLSRGPVSAGAKERVKRRVQNTRKIWATCSAAIFLISETAAYFEGEIIKESCDHFEAWIKTPAVTESLDETNESFQHEKDEGVAQRDPETLAAGHRSFLAALTYALLLTDVPYTRELRSLLGNLDSLNAFFNSLLDLQQKLDIEHEAGGASALTEEDETRVSLELDRSRKKVDSDLKSVVGRLRQLDHERIGSGRYLDIGRVESGGYEPWKGGGVDTLLMKLEFGRMTEEGFDLV